MSRAGRIIHGQLQRASAQAQLTERARTIVAWRTAAMADGWVVVPRFPGIDWREACTLHREGFLALCVTRNAAGDTLTIWGPDGLQVPTPNPYGWKAVENGLATCMFCGSETKHPYRVGEGGRACSKCTKG